MSATSSTGPGDVPVTVLASMGGAGGALWGMAVPGMTLRLVRALEMERTDQAYPLVHLLGHPYVSLGGNVASIAEGGARLLAFLALNRGPNERLHVAARLWPDVEEVRAAGNLRSALWRLNGSGVPLVHADKFTLTLRDMVEVDAQLLAEWAARLISGTRRPQDLSLMPWDIEQLEMLPGWYDDWILLERERLRQRLLHAMECLSRTMSQAGRHAEAVEAALVVVSADRLRESALRVLIEAHLREGNRAEAWQQFVAHRALVRRELGVEPSADLVALVSGQVSVAVTSAPR